MSSTFVVRPRNRGVIGFEADEEKEWKDSFCFIQAADPQFGLIDYLEGNNDGRGLLEEIRRAKASVAAAKKLHPRPRFFIVCGDLTHSENDKPNWKEQYEPFINIFSELEPEIPLLCVCGNHDIGNIPTLGNITKYRNTYGDDYYSFWCGGVLCIVLNSQYYEDSSLVENYAAEQESWLDSILKDIEKQKCKRSIIFQHIPCFLSSPDEEKQYFNFDVDVRKKMLKKFKAAGVSTVFCGHYHRNAGGFDENLEVVVTTAIGAQLGDEKPGMRVVTVLENEIRHEFHELDNFPTNIVL